MITIWNPDGTAAVLIGADASSSGDVPGGGGSSGGGAGYVPVVDLTGDLGGSYTLQPQKLYLLPDMKDIWASEMQITLNDAPDGVAGKWEFVVHVDTAVPLSIAGVEFASLPAYVAGTLYLFEIVADNHGRYGRFSALSQPDIYYLYNSQDSIPTCDTNTGGWNFNGVGLFNGTTQRVSIVAQNDAEDPNSLKLASYRDNGGNRYGNTVSTKQRIPFKTLYDAGYRSINFEVRSNPTNTNTNFYLIATKNIYGVSVNTSAANITANFSKAFPDAVSMVINNPATVYATHSISIRQILDAGINEGYVAVFHHADSSGTYNGLIRSIYANHAEPGST